MTKKELRKIIKSWLDENQIAFDPSLNTKNLLRFAEKNGFVSSDLQESFEETEENETIEENGDETIEENGDETIEETGDETIEETGDETIEENPESVEKVLPSKRTVKKTTSKSVENIPQSEPEKKTDSTWVYLLLGLAAAVLVIYLKNRKNGE